MERPVFTGIIVAAVVSVAAHFSSETSPNIAFAAQRFDNSSPTSNQKDREIQEAIIPEQDKLKNKSITITGDKLKNKSSMGLKS